MKRISKYTIKSFSIGLEKLSKFCDYPNHIFHSVSDTQSR